MKRTFAVILALAVFALSSASAFAGSVSPDENWVYEDLGDAGYQVDACYLTDADITVPTAFDGLPVIAVGAHIFMSSDTLRTFTANAPLESIGEYAFTDASALTSVTLPSTLTELGSGAFSGAGSLTTVNLGDTCVKSIGEYTFMGTAVNEIVIPDGCESIGDCAFKDCDKLTAVSIPESVTEIGENVFSGCDGLTISCPKGSAAARYAEENGIAWISTGKATYIKGDADGDRKVNIMDATRIQRLLAGFEVRDPDGARLRGDVSGDGLDILDANAIQRYIAGLDQENPYGIGECIDISDNS